MDVWGIALISACSALAGSVITGWFTRNSGARQAEAARYAGGRQADALLATVRMSLEEQRAERVLDTRRRTYLDFIAAVDAVVMAGRTGEGPGDTRAALRRAFGAVQLEGPAKTVRTAEDLIECLRDGVGASPDDQDRARQNFIDAARHAMASAKLPSDVLAVGLGSGRHVYARLRDLTGPEILESLSRTDRHRLSSAHPPPHRHEAVTT